MKVFFTGAGPGDPDLITVKGRKILEEADIVLYAGSLVSREMLLWARDDAEIHDTASMDFDEVTSVMLKHKAEEGVIARVHTGDPSLYGAIGEQIEFCRKEEIPWEVIPGVSSFSASAAALGQELTLPGISQSVVITRRGGRTPVPSGQELAEFARTGATLVLFLTSGMAGEAMEEIRPHYGPDAPAATVYRASWKDQKICRGTVSTIAGLMEKEGISRQAIIIVGHVLGAEDLEKSLLYDPSFSHGYRKGK